MAVNTLLFGNVSITQNIVNCFFFFSSPQQLVTGNHNHIHISLSKTVTLSQFFRTTSDLVRANVSLLLANCYQIFTTLTVGPKPNQAIYLSIFTIKSVIQRFTYSFTSDFCYHLSGPIQSKSTATQFTKFTKINNCPLQWSSFPFASARKRTGGVTDVCGVSLYFSLQFFC